jgi:hypothetical protein
MRALMNASIGFALVLAASVTASAQSLSSVAAREAQRRMFAEPGRLYTNADLRFVADVQPRAEAARVGLVGAEPQQKTDEHSEAPPARVVAREKRDDEYWRARENAIRARLQQAEEYAAGLEARLADLEESASGEAVKERQVVVAKIARAQRDVEFIRRELTMFEGRVRPRNTDAN